jgi:hypothetical protein
MKRWIALLSLVALSICPAFADDGPVWTENVQVTGEVDGRIVIYDNFSPDNKDIDDVTGSDVYIYRAIMGIEAEPTEGISGVFSVLYEEDRDTGQVALPEEEFRVEEAYVKFNLFWAFFQAGRFYQDFTELAPLAVSDPLTYTLGETRKTGLEAGLESEYFTASFAAFNGAVDLADDEEQNIDNWVAHLAIRPLTWTEDYDLEIGGAFLSDATETAFDFTTLFDPNSPYEDDIGAWSAYLNSQLNFHSAVGLAMRGEMVRTLEFAKVNYLDTAGEMTTISAYNAELGLVIFKHMIFGGKYDSISGMDWLNAELFEPSPISDEYQAKQYARYGGFFGSHATKSVDMKIEYLHGSDDENNVTDEVNTQFRVRF